MSFLFVALGFAAYFIFNMRAARKKQSKRKDVMFFDREEVWQD